MKTLYKWMMIASSLLAVNAVNLPFVSDAPTASDAGTKPVNRSLIKKAEADNNTDDGYPLLENTYTTALVIKDSDPQKIISGLGYGKEILKLGAGNTTVHFYTPSQSEYNQLGAVITVLTKAGVEAQVDDPYNVLELNDAKTFYLLKKGKTGILTAKNTPFVVEKNLGVEVGGIWNINPVSYYSQGFDGFLTGLYYSQAFVAGEDHNLKDDTAQVGNINSVLNSLFTVGQGETLKLISFTNGAYIGYRSSVGGNNNQYRDFVIGYWASDNSSEHATTFLYLWQNTGGYEGYNQSTVYRNTVTFSEPLQVAKIDNENYYKAYVRSSGTADDNFFLDWAKKVGYASGYASGLEEGQSNPTFKSFIVSSMEACQAFFDLPIMGDRITVGVLIGGFIGLGALFLIIKLFR